MTKTNFLIFTSLMMVIFFQAAYDVAARQSNEDNENDTNVLPLLSFDAMYNGTAVKLSWVTANEKSSCLYSLERSIDGKKFSSIYTKEIQENSSTLLTYKAEDANPFNAVSFYRLTKTDFEGHLTYSEIIPLRIKKTEASLLLFEISRQNSSIHAEINFPYDVRGIIEITDLAGNKLLSNGFTANAEILNFNFDANNISSGVYYLRVLYEGQFLLKKFVY